MNNDIIKAAREAWWKTLVKQGDPSLVHNLAWKAFDAGYIAGANAEIERCAAIVSLARFGEIDRDFRSIIYRIESHSPAESDAEADARHQSNG